MAVNQYEILMDLLAGYKETQDALRDLAKAIPIYLEYMEEERQLQLKKEEEQRLQKKRADDWQRQQDEQEREDFFYDDEWDAFYK